MKVYTKKGDKGETALLGGSRVPKHHARIEAYGTVDELNAHIGLLRDLKIDEEHKPHLLQIQDDLFTMGSMLALDSKKGNIQIPVLEENAVKALEEVIDLWHEQLPEMRSFVLPGGHVIVSQCHIARCVCRRAERCVTLLAEKSEVEEIVLIYLNRLSDLLFVLSRKLCAELGATETPWQPKSKK